LILMVYGKLSANNLPRCKGEKMAKGMLIEDFLAMYKIKPGKYRMKEKGTHFPLVKTVHVRTTIDDGIVVYRQWHGRYGWKYGLDTTKLLQELLEKGELERVN